MYFTDACTLDKVDIDKIAKHWFLVAWNAIKMRYSSMVFMFTSETWCEIDANFIQCAS